MFGITLTWVVTLMHGYVFWRVASVPLVKRRVPRKALVGLGVVLWTAFFLGRVYGHGGTSAPARALELFGMTWMGVLFLTCICLVAVDIITGLGFFLPRFAPRLRGLALAAGGVLSAIALVQGLRPPVVEDYEVHLAGLGDEMDGTVLVAMSDLHLGSLLGPRWLEARIAQVRAERPDLVVLLGDISEGHGPDHKEFLPALRRLSAPLGVWAVLGNHERHGGGNRGVSMIEDAGFHLLGGSWAEVRPGLVLAGVDDLGARAHSSRSGDPICDALSGRPEGATVLLSHRPLQSDKAASTGVGLMLSGHTHGGQIWPFGYLIRRRYPLFEGRYVVSGMTVIVCRGTGTWGPRMRLWRPGEILRVTLRRK